MPTYYHCYDFEDAPAYHRVAYLPTAGVSMGGMLSSYMYFRSLVRDMADLRQAGIMKGIVNNGGVVSLGQSHEGRELETIVIGNGGAKRVLIVGGTHAREWIAVEVPYLLAKFLIDNYPAMGEGTTLRERRVKHLVDNREIWIVPMLNPDGHEYSRSTNRSWRANRRPVDIATTHTIDHHWAPGVYRRFYQLPDTGRTPIVLHGGHSNQYINVNGSTRDHTCTQAVSYGMWSSSCGGGHTVTYNTIKKGRYTGVDINRNYPCASWGALRGRREGGEPDFNIGFVPGTEDYCGLNAASEPETQHVVQAMQANAFRAVLSYHNYGEVLLLPDAVVDGTPAVTDARTVELGARMVDLIHGAGGNGYRLVLGQALYPTAGDMGEWVYEAYGIPAYTAELSPADASGGEFSYLPEDQIDTVFDQNLRAALAFINCAPHTPLLANNATHDVVQVGVPRPQVLQVVRNCWKVFEHF